jgi:hypothetical protein
MIGRNEVGPTSDHFRPPESDTTLLHVDVSIANLGNTKSYVIYDRRSTKFLFACCQLLG